MKHLLTRIGILVWLAASIESGNAQPWQEFRMEIAGKAADKPIEIITLGAEGLALVHDLQEYAQGNKKWQVDLVDTTLTRYWTAELNLDNQLLMVGFEHQPGRLYLLFRESQTTFSNFDLVVLNLREKTIQTDKIRFDLNFKLTHFTVAGTTALFGGYVNTEPAVLLFNHTSDKPKVLPGLFSRDISLLDLRANLNDSFNVLLLEVRRGTSQRLIVRTFDPSGNLLIDDMVDVDQKYSLLSGLTSRLALDDMLIVGTYGEGHGKEVMGFYSVKVDPFNQQAIQYTDLTSVAHFLDYLPEKKAKKILEKASKERLAGRSPKFKSNLVPIRLEEVGQAYYLFAEVFHPPSSVTYYPYGSPYWNSYYGSPFGSPSNPYRPYGYDAPRYQDQLRNSDVRMIESVVLRYRPGAAAPEGSSMKYEDVRRPLLDQTGDFMVRKESVVQAYKFNTDLIFQTESEDVLAKPTPGKSAIRLLNANDVLKDEIEDSGGLRFWYGSRFYAWGYRRIRSMVNEEVETRYVFYVNRVDF